MHELRQLPLFAALLKPTEHRRTLPLGAPPSTDRCAHLCRSGLTARAGAESEPREERDERDCRRNAPPQYICRQVIEDRVPVSRKRIGQRASALHLRDLLVRQLVVFNDTATTE